jgi:hypothetical protein
MYCTKGAKNFYAPLVLVSIWGRKRTHADKTVYQNGSNDICLDPPLFSLDSTFKKRKIKYGIPGSCRLDSLLLF